MSKVTRAWIAWVLVAGAPVKGLPETKVGAFSPAHFDEAKKGGWTVISMKDERKQIFAWEK